MTEEQLGKYKELKKEKDQIKGLLSEIEGRVYSPSAPKLTGLPTARSQTGGSPQEKAACSTMELRERYHNKIEELDRQLLEIEEAIEGLASRERRILRHKYIEGLTWEQVGDVSGYCERHARRIHDRAIKKLKEEPGA